LCLRGVKKLQPHPREKRHYKKKRNKK
jgi:hypothetical protein